MGANVNMSGSGGSGGFSFGGTNGLSLLSGIANGMASWQQANTAATEANARIEIMKRQQDEEYTRRVRNAVYALQETEMANTQANESLTQAKTDIQREALKSREMQRATASSAGIAGNVVNRMVSDISFTEQQQLAVADSNRDNIIATQQLKKHAAVESTRMDPFYYTEPEGGSFFNSMLGVIPALFSGFNFGLSGSASASTAPCQQKVVSPCSMRN